jgi:hypothetical protein
MYIRAIGEEYFASKLAATIFVQPVSASMAGAAARGHSIVPLERDALRLTHSAARITL